MCFCHKVKKEERPKVWRRRKKKQRKTTYQPSSNLTLCTNEEKVFNFSCEKYFNHSKTMLLCCFFFSRCPLIDNKVRREWVKPKKFRDSNSVIFLLFNSVFFFFSNQMSIETNVIMNVVKMTKFFYHALSLPYYLRVSF